jgi:hypothetical protein
MAHLMMISFFLLQVALFSFSHASFSNPSVESVISCSNSTDLFVNPVQFSCLIENQVIWTSPGSFFQFNVSAFIPTVTDGNLPVNDLSISFIDLTLVNTTVIVNCSAFSTFGFLDEESCRSAPLLINTTGTLSLVNQSTVNASYVHLLGARGAFIDSTSAVNVSYQGANVNASGARGVGGRGGGLCNSYQYYQHLRDHEKTGPLICSCVISVLIQFNTGNGGLGSICAGSSSCASYSLESYGSIDGFDPKTKTIYGPGGAAVNSDMVIYQPFELIRCCFDLILIFDSLMICF